MRILKQSDFLHNGFLEVLTGGLSVINHARYSPSVLPHTDVPPCWHSDIRTRNYGIDDSLGELAKVGRISIPGFRCERCGHQWVSHAQIDPKTCPRCKSRLWDTPVSDAVRSKRPIVKPWETENEVIKLVRADDDADVRK